MGGFPDGSERSRCSYKTPMNHVFPQNELFAISKTSLAFLAIVSTKQFHPTSIMAPDRLLQPRSSKCSECRQKCLWPTAQFCINASWEVHSAQRGFFVLFCFVCCCCCFLTCSSRYLSRADMVVRQIGSQCGCYFFSGSPNLQGPCQRAVLWYGGNALEGRCGAPGRVQGKERMFNTGSDWH